ncbi:hypothetical protein EQG41_20875 [Billgrantia azerbaijanica]|nr:hypothetical protein EQG41_20875 [Halomonas azerbaijanica]
MRHLIGLAARSYDPEGALLIPRHPDNDTGSLSRRVSRTATLDGGAAITNRGYTPADRTLRISLEGQPPAMVARAKRLLRLHGGLIVSLADGAYTATASEYSDRDQRLTLLVTGTA